ncbi:hypothetical protein CAC42_728 [Sphaceloma murrayae]|uniref:Uncharacterized protein n=1 Tax=Sphaceloma murrayae TaxID=2082308 RepID=A0A2K1QKR5_9PEZI|nr:hypothetical protein CAC42_728 [Sphaceloma murrayae]
MPLALNAVTIAAAIGIGASILHYLNSGTGGEEPHDRDDPVSTKIHPRLFSSTKIRSTVRLKELTSQTLSPAACPTAVSTIKNVPIYDCSKLDITDHASKESLMAEFYSLLLYGPGVLVLKNMYHDKSVLDTTNAVFDSLLASERAAGNKGDHFSSSSTNSRLWNSFSKHCLYSPSSFLDYYSNPYLSLISESYLGPSYRITTQLNIVHPSGPAQTCHRDYHLGFQDPSSAARFPRAMHMASQLLTLQGAIAHTDMPLLSGPTRLLPFSQLLEDGYMAHRDESFQSFFQENHVAVPLEKGDGLFFNPALYHAAGENRTVDSDRSANLVQVSSAFGKTMESVDSLPLVDATWDLLREKTSREGTSGEVVAFVQAVAEGYPFPTNLDRRPPAPGGMAPESEQGLLMRALREGWDRGSVLGELRRMREDSKA